MALGYCVECKNNKLVEVIGKREKALCNTHYWASKRTPIKSKPAEIKRSPIKKNKSYVIPKVTAKQAKRNAQYNKQRGPYLLRNPYCVIRAEGCTHMATQVHHGQGRLEDRHNLEREVPDNLLDEETWRGCCQNCHDIVEANSDWAKEHGHSLIRTK